MYAFLLLSLSLSLSLILHASLSQPLLWHVGEYVLFCFHSYLHLHIHIVIGTLYSALSVLYLVSEGRVKAVIVCVGEC